MSINPDARERIAKLSPRQRELLARRMADRRGSAATGDVRPIPRRPPGPVPLSFAQQRLWFLDQLDPGSPHYNIPLAARIRGPLDAAVLERGFNVLVRRHESLRTTFALTDAGPVQTVHDEMFIPVEVQDLSGLPADRRQEAADAMVAEHGRTSFDLRSGPLLRVGLLRLGPEDNILMATVHHIIADTWSIRVIIGELSATYEALTHGQQPPLAELPIQYADYAHWHRGWLQGDVLDAQVAYWREQLAGELPMLDLPLDRPRPPEPSFAGAQRLHVLPTGLSNRIEEFAAEAGTSAFSVLLAGLAVLLHRYSGQDKVSIGSPISNRARPELEDMVGYLSNTVLLRIDLSGEPSFREVVRRAHEVNVGAQSNQDLPFDKIVEIAQPERDVSGTPLIQVMYVYRSERPGGAEPATGLPGIETSLSVGNGTSKFDLTFSLEFHSGAYALNIEYATDLFEESTVLRMAGHLETLVGAMVARPDLPVGTQPMLTDAERRRVLVEWNDTAADYPSARCLHELVEEVADRTPDAVAVSSRRQSLTYRELDQRANRLAHHLRDLGAGPDVPVAISMEKSVDMVLGLLAILKAGSGYLPLDPDYPAERLAFMLADSGARLLLTHQAVADRLPTADGVTLVRTDAPSIADRPPHRPPASATPDSLVSIIYTSGSSGRPKGVLLAHRGWVNNFHDFNRRFSVGPDDAVLALASSSFDMSAYDVFGTLAAGARVSLPDPGSERNPENWLETCLRDGVTIWHSVPALLEMFVEYCAADPDARMPGLRLALLGGDWIPLTLPDRLRDLVPGVQVISLGGATEVSMDSTIYPVRAVDPRWPSIPYGRPLANQRCFVLDSRLQPVPVGVAGELYLGGVGVGRGYANAPELTEQRFLPNPLPEWPGERIYRTGDRARYHADGNLELLGRTDFQIKLRGWRIEPGEVEAALRAQHGVKDALATVSARRLVGYLVPEPDARPDLAQIKDRLRASLPPHLVPAVLVELDELPLTANGKVDRMSLPAPAPEPGTGDSEPTPPRTRVERILAGIWQELLPGERIGVHDNFFELGGDSITAIRVITQARRLGVALTPKQLFQHQSIAELAAVAEDAEMAAGAVDGGAGLESPTEAERAALRAAHPGMVDAYPLTPMQRHMLRRSLSDPRSGQYIIQADYLFTPGSMDMDTLVAAWRDVVARHPILRSSFAWEGLSEPVQIVHETAPLEVMRHDLTGCSVDEQVARQDEVVAADRARGFDLTEAPLLRLHFLEIAPGAFKYIFTNHHIVLDGWSRAIVQQEVFRTYEALLAGERPALGDQRSFRDYVAWIRARQGDPERFWRSYLEGVGEPTPLVRSRGRREPVPGPEFAKQRVPMPDGVSAAVQAFCRRHQLTVNTVIQGAWLLLLSRYTGASDVVLGVTSAGRSADFVGVDTVVGVCMNTLPVRARVQPGERLLPWLAALQSEQVDLRQYEHTPIETVLGRELVDIFECHMVFENYPWDGSLATLAPRIDFQHPMAQRDYQVAQFEFPLRVEVVPGPPQLLIMHYYPGVFTHDTIAGMLADWQSTIDRIVRDPDQTLAAVLAGGEAR